MRFPIPTARCVTLGVVAALLLTLFPAAAQDGVLAGFACICTLRTGPEPPGVDEVIQGRPGHAGDLGNGVLGDAEPEEVTDFILLAVRA